jgi:hypothetical protein
LLVYDITQASSLEALEYFTEMIDIEREDRMEQNEILPVCFVAGNKCDLQGNRQIAAKDGMDWSRKHGFGFMETSAREMVNIEETFARKLMEEECCAAATMLMRKQSSSVALSKRGRTQPPEFPKNCQLLAQPTLPADPITKQIPVLPMYRRRNFHRHRRRNPGIRPSSAGDGPTKALTGVRHLLWTSLDLLMTHIYCFYHFALRVRAWNLDNLDTGHWKGTVGKWIYPVF